MVHLRRNAFDVARVRDRDDDVLVGDQVLDLHVEGLGLDFRAAFVSILLLHLEELGLDDVQDPFSGGEDASSFSMFFLRPVCSARSFSISSPVSCRKAMARIAFACASDSRYRLVSPASASAASRARRIRRITSSRWSTAVMRPSTIWSRSRAFRRSNSVRRRTIMTRWSTWYWRTSFSVRTFGSPPTRARLITPKVCSICV